MFQNEMLGINWSYNHDQDLKRRFIIFTMTAVTCLLVFIVLAINGLNWMMLDRQSDMVLDILVESDGAFQNGL